MTSSKSKAESMFVLQQSVEVLKQSLAEGVKTFKKRGWLLMETPIRKQRWYLVKNKMLKVPDKSLPKVTPQELELFRDLKPDERDLLLYALGIFKGEMV
tara:strand:- start:115 stop:411 length:297 start_codon:yes stop_codon:yes gene_type:complete